MSERDVIAHRLTMHPAHGITPDARKKADETFRENDPETAMIYETQAGCHLAALSAAGLVVVPREIQETPIEAAFWAAEDQYKALVAANVWPRPIRAVYIWDALLAAALPAAPQEDRT